MYECISVCVSACVKNLSRFTFIYVHVVRCLFCLFKLFKTQQWQLSRLPPLLVARWAHSRLQLDEQFATYPNVKNMKRMKITTSYLFIDTEFCLQSFDGAYFKWMYANNVNKSADLISSCFFRVSRQEFFNNAQKKKYIY